eukprot:TRINITY_DN15359_c0_g1_i6.p1 TRINITY_DN15359_c0_g1~~TRINITY_DN15359_c0_g1_i6.p1  ORF type:complete len:355 (+),score=66.51 TRINITY_DN15359_c0_g1_i6:190-1254(+)
MGQVMAMPVCIVLILVAGWLEPNYSISNSYQQVWGVNATRSTNGSAISWYEYTAGLLLLQLGPVLVLLALMVARVGMAAPKSEDLPNEMAILIKILQRTWRDPISGPHPWYWQMLQGALGGCVEEVGFRLIFAQTAMNVLNSVRALEHALGSLVGVMFVLMGACMTLKEVAFEDPVSRSNMGNDDLRVLKKVGSGLLLVAFGVFQMHTFHVNGQAESTILHVFHTDEAHRALAGHPTIRNSVNGIQIPMVDSSTHNHHEVDVWVHLYGSNGLTHYLAELLLTISDNMCLFGTYQVSNPIKHAFVQGALVANLGYVWYKSCEPSTVPVLGQVQVWVSGLGPVSYTHLTLPTKRIV